MTYLIVDDNPMARLALRSLADQLSQLTFLGECESALEAHAFLSKNRADLLFLDVEMPGMSGLELVQSLTFQPLVVLVSSKSEYAIEGFNLRVVDYILKPATLPRLAAAVQRAQQFFAPTPPPATPEPALNHLFVRVNQQLVRLELDEVFVISAMGDYIVFLTADKKIPVHLTMKEIEQKLPEQRFLRVHRSHIVSVEKISKMEENSLQVGKHIVPVSESYKAALMQRMNIL